jgi:hypothetical protein
MKKIHVFVDDSGAILGTTPVPGTTSQQGTVFLGGIPEAMGTFRVVEVEPWPDDVLGLSQLSFQASEATREPGKEVEVFHRRLAEHIESNRLPAVDEYLTWLK